MNEKLWRRDSDLETTFDHARPAPGKSTVSSRLPVFRAARDGNGVANDAEASVDRAAGSSGSPLAPELMDRFESSLGTDLSGVRVHTGAESAEAASAVGARAYTVGQDIHFGAGQYDPSSAFGVHLLAHEVAHTVQQQGATPTRQHKLEVSTPGDASEVEADRAADAMVAGARATISSATTGTARKLLQREGDGTGGAGGAGQVAPPSTGGGGGPDCEYVPGQAPLPQLDMQPYDYSGLMEIGPDNPSPLAITLDPEPPPPKAPWVGETVRPAEGKEWADCSNPDFTAEGDPVWQEMLGVRAGAWAAFGDAAMHLVTNWNSIVPHVNAFNVTTKEKETELQNAYELVPGGGKKLDELANNTPGGLANLQGDTDPNPITVAKLFNDGEVPVGTEVDLGKDGAGAVGDLEGKFKAEYRLITQADSNLKEGLGFVETAASMVNEAHAAVDTAMAKIDYEKAVKDKDKAADEKAAIEKNIAAAKVVAVDVQNVLKAFALGAVKSAVPLPDTMTDRGKTAQHTKDVLAESAWASIANRVIDAAYASRLSAASQKYASAVAAVQSAADNVAAAQMTEAMHKVSTAESELQARKDKIPGLLAARRAAYDAFAAKVAERAKKSGKVDEDSANRLRAALAAIPIVEVVRTHAESAKTAATLPGYSAEAGMGVMMGVMKPDMAAGKFLVHYGHLAGYLSHFDGEFTLWDTRLRALRGIIDQLRLSAA